MKIDVPLIPRTIYLDSRNYNPTGNQLRLRKQDWLYDDHFSPSMREDELVLLYVNTDGQFVDNILRLGVVRIAAHPEHPMFDRNSPNFITYYVELIG